MSMLRMRVKELVEHIRSHDTIDLPPSIRVRIDEIQIALVLDRSPAWSGDINDTSCVPNELRAGLDRYVHGRIRCGDFLHAVLENNLKAAVGTADPTNIQILPSIVTYVQQSIPAVAWGSAQRVKDWLLGRYEGEVSE